MARLSATAWKATQFMTSRNYEINFYCDKDFKTVSPHSHDFFELYYFIQGGVSYIIENERYHLEPNDILLISPSNLHQLDIFDSKTSYERMVLWINPKYLKSISSEETDLSICFRLCTEKHSHIIRDVNLSEQIRAQLDALCAAPQNEFGSDIASEMHIKQVLLSLCRHLRQDLEEGNKQKEGEKGNSTVFAAVEYINAHLAENLSLDTLAEKLFISKYHLAHLFKQGTNVTPHQYILKKRLILSKRLIEQDLPIIEVFSRCGFADYTHFFRAFKGEYGITPKQYHAITTQNQ